jgi:hypothetical protein
MNTTLGFRFRNTLNPVSTGFMFKFGKNLVSADQSYNLFKTTDPTGTAGKNFNLTSLAVSITAVHI